MPTSSEPCAYVLDGTDTDGTAWYLCTTHDELAPSDAAPCNGYHAPPYVEPATARDIRHQPSPVYPADAS